MVDFHPFRGIRYSSSAGEISSLICPPYDVISDEDRETLLSKNEYNMVRLELSEATSGRDPQEYASSSLNYSSWLSHGILFQDENPSFYMLRQSFISTNGIPNYRYSLIGALRLEELGKRIKPHENTGIRAKNDRMELMESVQANFSPLFMLFRDHEHQIKSMMAEVELQNPIMEATLIDEEFSVWAIEDDSLIEAIQKLMATKNVYIADGHHRYETSLQYSKKHADLSSQYVMSALVSFDDSGLKLLPYNRFISNLDGRSLSLIVDRVYEYFEVERIPITDYRSLSMLLDQKGNQGLSIAMVESNQPFVSILNPKLNKIENLISENPQHSSMSDIEAWILQEIIFRPVLGDNYDEYVFANHDGQLIIKAVENKTAQIGFLLKGMPLDVFERVVDSGIKLPRKSTYFWPKLPSGLLIKNLSDSKESLF
ncbi:MAG: hypothetical protein CL889_03835 [Dehalococcoidia bacterium]|nr:hypothetical protein [Dehalococcoidia bacterium]